MRAADLGKGDRVAVVLRLPSGFGARIPAHVVELRRDPRGDTPELLIELTGLSAHAVERLRALAAPTADSAPPLPPESRRKARGRVTARGTPAPERIDEWESTTWEQLMVQVCSRMRVSELIESNQRLRDQIDDLYWRMRPRD